MSADRLHRLFRLTAAVVLATAAAGCAGYRLGSSLPPEIRSVHVPPFANACNEPQIEVETTRATVQEFQRNGALRLAGAGEADAVLRVELVKYELDPLRYEQDRARTTREYRLRILAHVIFTPKRKGMAPVDRYVTGETTFLPAGDLSSAKVNALPAAARDLAHQIVKSVVDYWP